MTKGSWIHDDVSRHFRSCTQCRETDAENKRHKHDRPGQVSEADVPKETLAAMCSDGRAIYRAYLRWLAEPDW
jgi:hypothetical protein